MPLLVNGVEVEDAAVAHELAQGTADGNAPRGLAIAAVLRRLLKEEAARVGIAAADDEGMIRALLAREVSLPEPDAESCRRHYDAHSARFRAGEWADVAHILFQVTPRVPLAALQQIAETTLAAATADPDAFGALARARSNCPSAVDGGRLGRVVRGECVPEFERAVFATTATGVLPQLVQTRHGFHVVRVEGRSVGTPLPFETVQPAIAAALRAASRDRAWKQYASLLMSRADIQGIDLDDLRGDGSPLLQ